MSGEGKRSSNSSAKKEDFLMAKSVGSRLNSWASLFRLVDPNLQWRDSKEIAEKIEKIQSSTKGRVKISESDLKEARKVVATFYGVWIDTDNSSFFKSVVYENLPLVCFGCGMVGHIETNCKLGSKKIIASEGGNVTDSPPDSMFSECSVGPWVQVQRRKRVFKNQVPVKNVDGNSFKVLNNPAFEDDMNKVEHAKKMNTEASISKGTKEVWREIIKDNAEKKKEVDCMETEKKKGKGVFMPGHVSEIKDYSNDSGLFFF
ncbi:hypothetical protein Cni_G13299 [Canna indica]|uniref:CCHC-type domain-containing protein n=1 Tax=Canna indica TaxID=4628 RepID=A0AAQ3K9A1_9LILI|nr:hypothetical protein Cni_G13299 [Canna indica]